MNPDLKHVHKHILSLALGALSHANRHACYSCRENRWWSALSVLQAGHAAELLIKGRIAQEHPLLIFEQIPQSTKNSAFLEFGDLFERGKTLQYFDLPERLWATTGIRIGNIELYRSFGRLRNALQHFGAEPNRDLSRDTLSFVFGVIDPFIHECWGLYAIDYDEDHVPYEAMFPAIVSREVVFNVSPGAASCWKIVEELMRDSSESYRSEMRRRRNVALNKPGTSNKMDREWWQCPGPWYGGRSGFSMDDLQLISCNDRIPADQTLVTSYTDDPE